MTIEKIMSDSILNKPLPDITDQTRPFWTAAKEGRLEMQKCPSCGTLNFHPKPWCIECGTRGLEWVEVSPTGTVYSYTISRSVAMNYPGWQAELPVLLCLIDLDDGVRLYGQVTDCDAQVIQVGMRVGVHFESISDDAGIPKFHPLS